MKSSLNPRQLAFLALREIYLKQAYTDIAIDRVLRKVDLISADRGLFNELVYGVVRRERSLDALIDRLGKKKASQQPPDLRIILHLGLYQLRYLDRIPESAAVNTSVELAKTNGYAKLAAVVNGLLREYQRLAMKGDPLPLPKDPISRLGVSYSFPDWIVEIFYKQYGSEEAEQILSWFDRTPSVDLRVNSLLNSTDEVRSALVAVGLNVTRVNNLPQSLRIIGGTGAITKLPGYEEGWWMVQDSSAQLVTHLLDPQPGELIIDACAAPGGKTTHIAELMKDKGTIWAIDREPKRLRKVKENARRLQLTSIQTLAGDGRDMKQFKQTADRVLIDAPCSGLGTLHKRPDLRSSKPEKIDEIISIQKALLEEVATWLKPGGILVYSTCTLNRAENEEIVKSFLADRVNWKIQPPPSHFPALDLLAPEGWLEILPHQHLMDGFFMVKLKKGFEDLNE
jgi:16S rRNA (cytosine967-C5)-methyltransferase